MKRKAIVEKRFNYKGRECIIIFSYMGYRCGYVSLKDNEVNLVERDLCGKKHIEIDYMSMNIDCHGGLTFGNKLNTELEPKHEYYVGFDCAHCWDGQDLKYANELGLYGGICISHDKIVVSLEECVKNCKSIVEQLNKEKK